MGGPGSGNHDHWWRSAKKATVEECLALDANRWMREGILKAGVRLSGGWRWLYHGGKENNIRYEADTREPARPFVRLSYTVTRAGTEKRQALASRVALTTTRPRWWFVCPLVVRDCPCERRVGKLYLPPGGRYFGCRHCHELTYTSAQTHDGRVPALRRDPELLAAILENPQGTSVHQLILAMKALG